METEEYQMSAHCIWEEGVLVTEIIANHKLCLIVLIGDAAEDSILKMYSVC